jgi:hypothetical protein
MRTAFAHDAVLRMADGADTDAPGGAITVYLCGHWDHPAPCPLAPHHTRSIRDGNRVTLRILFAAEPDQEHFVRERILIALQGGQLKGPDGRHSSWTLLSSSAGTITPDEADHASKLAVI